MKRTTSESRLSELMGSKDMVFLCGPRQSGKTTLAKDISESFSNRVYFNWDHPNSKALLIKKPEFFTEAPLRDRSVPLVVLDEIHKYKNWKNYLKGVFDKFYGQYKFLVTGSGRLDIYHRGGDSLAGRYEMLHLWPFTLSELSKNNLPMQKFIRDPQAVVDAQFDASMNRTWTSIMELSGFPEPFQKSNISFWRRWSRNYSKQVIREDIRDATGLRHIDQVELLFTLLPGKVGAPLSVNSLAGDIQVTHNTVKSWLNILERFFFVFQLSPWSDRISRAIHKEKKLYLFNIPLIESIPSRFENAVAVELFSSVSAWNDMGLGDFSLHYVRNKEKEEVDFLIAKSR
ncbi:MAG TPA: AAA family ATPase, partial [Victivallales bacterium]|nr:AAA family ATPase [Victivallales bacterium]